MSSLTASVNVETLAVSRSRSGPGGSASASSCNAVSGVRSRCDRSATCSRSAASRSWIRSASSLTASPTVTISDGPDGDTRASRSPWWS